MSLSPDYVFSGLFIRGVAAMVWCAPRADEVLLKVGSTVMNDWVWPNWLRVSLAAVIIGFSNYLFVFI
jgi:hypothetical protein